MRDLDKNELGTRIRKIRSRAGLRQWELARMLGTTQSAVHKYEHGVVPEPRRLVELARIGNTSIEWILTGRHWENGSEDQTRLAPELMEIACVLRDLAPRERESVTDALKILEEAVHALTADSPSLGGARPEMVLALREHSVETLRLVESAWRIQRAVLSRLTREAAERLTSSPLLGEPPESTGRETDRPD